MPNQPTPGQQAYETYAKGMQPHHAMSLWRFLPPYCQHAWEAVAQAVLDDDSEGLDSARIAFRYAIGAVLRLAGSPCPWTVCQRRWVERAIMPPYAEYAVQSPEGLICWEVEADLVLWEETLTLDLDPDVRQDAP